MENNKWKLVNNSNNKWKLVNDPKIDLINKY